jgi:arylsulfatase A-like enzyme
MKIDVDKRSLLANLIILTTLIVCLQLALVITHMMLCGGAENFFENKLLIDIFTSHLVWLPLLAWLGCQIILYAGFIAIIWIVTILCGELFNCKKVTTQLLGMLLWCVSVTAVWLANSVIYPHSYFTALTDKFLLPLAQVPYRQVVQALASIVMVTVVLASVQLIKTVLQRKTRRHHKIVISMMVMLLAVQISYSFHTLPAVWQSATQAKPNIILIGLDGVRPDFVNQDITTPNINKFLNDSANFTNAYTMIAQTLPSWVSILTGVGPKSNLVRENLADLSLVNTDDTLAKRLQALGYETLFATDDSRFNNITKDFGFDRLVKPRPGVVEYILGEFNDFPLSNLVVRTALGKWMFPYNYGSHESLATYDPNNFMELIQQQLNHPTAKPLFLAVHFNVSGWPFGWYNSSQKNAGIWYFRYTESIRQADLQLGKFIDVLQQHNLLKNALVVLLSDHGVTLGLPDDRAITEKSYQGDATKLAMLDKTIYLQGMGFSTRKTLATSYGYGGDLLSPHQLHVLLAFKSYGVTVSVGSNNAMSSLIDIAPTVLDLLQQPPLAKQEGKSLLPVLKNVVTANVSRDLYFETSGPSFLGYPTEPALTESLESFIENYNFDHINNAIVIKPVTAQQTMSRKQRAVLAGNWLLVELPGLTPMKVIRQGNGQFAMLRQYNPSFMVLLEISTGKWTTELNSAWAAAAPVKELCAKLTRYYGSELKCTTCCVPPALTLQFYTTLNEPHGVDNQKKS